VTLLRKSFPEDGYAAQKHPLPEATGVQAVQVRRRSKMTSTTSATTARPHFHHTGCRISGISDWWRIHRGAASRYTERNYTIAPLPRGASVSLNPRPVPDVPELTARTARAAFPKGNPYLDSVTNSDRSSTTATSSSSTPGADSPRCPPGGSPWSQSCSSPRTTPIDAPPTPSGAA
jgi:hypothetical protein